MYIWYYVFILSCSVIFYNYIGYAIIALGFNRIKRIFKKSVAEENRFPNVSFIVASYNEESCIEEKLRNSLDQDYPKDRIEFIFVTDGSSDGTNSIISKYSQVHLLFIPERQGKSAAVNRAVLAAKNEILIFSDANALLNKDATAKITHHYNDRKIGGVAGEKKVLPSASATDEVGAGEGLYWKYEALLKKIDSEFYSVVGAAGELFSVRKELYDVIDHSVILDDFVLSLQVAQKGYRIAYEPGAYAMELPSASLKDEQKRKIRIAAGGFQAIKILAPLFAFWRYPRLSFLYISHRVLRWTLSPLCFITALISNIILAFFYPSTPFTVTLLLQSLFYAAALLALYVPSDKGPLKILKLPYYLVFMNISVLKGFVRFMERRQSGTWEKVKRAQA